jgi:hypothetical protein
VEVRDEEKEKRRETRSEGGAAQEVEALGVMDSTAPLGERASSLRAQTASLALNKQGVHPRSNAAWPG